MNLDKFIEMGLVRLEGAFRPFNQHIEEPCFETLYLRLWRRYIHRIYYQPVLDIASVSVEEEFRGQGIFTDLLTRIRKRHPALHIFVENVLTPRFGIFFQRSGFFVMEPRTDPACSYFLPAQETIK